MRFLFPRALGKWGCEFQSIFIHQRSDLAPAPWRLAKGWVGGWGWCVCLQKLGTWRGQSHNLDLSFTCLYYTICFQSCISGSCSHSRLQLCFRGLRGSNVYSWAPWNGENRGNRWSVRTGTAVQRVGRPIARYTYVSWQQETLGYTRGLWLKI